MSNTHTTGFAHWRTWLVSQINDLGPRRLLWTAVLFALATAASYWSQSLGKPLTAPLAYLLGVTVIGATQGLVLGTASALVAAAIFNFAITDPIFVFRLSDIDDLVPIFAFTLSALIAGTLAGRLKDSVAEAQKAARDLSDLLEASKVLQSVLTPTDLAAAITRFGPFQDNAQIVLLTVIDGVATPVGDSGVALPAALPTDPGTPAEQEIEGWTVYALRSAHRLLGLLLIRARGPRPRLATTAHLHAYINMVTITLERCYLLERLANAQALERSEAFKTALLSSVSHDMRTPLATITASVSGLMEYEQNISAEIRTQLFKTIMEQCARLNRYTTDLLNLGRIEAGLDANQFAVIDVVEVFGRAVNGIRATLESREIVKALPASPLFTKGDATLLEQVIHNVLENAVAYSADGSQINVELTTADNCLRATITDEGIGVPPSQIARIFDRFYRIEHPGARVRGSGLGLAIAKAFTEAVGGRIYAESPIAHGVGTRIVIELPLCESA